MSDHERSRCSLFRRHSQELPRETTTDVSIERDKVRDPKTAEDRKQQQRIFGRFAERLSLFDQQLRPLCRGFGFRRSIPFDM